MKSLRDARCQWRAAVIQAYDEMLEHDGSIDDYYKAIDRMRRSAARLMGRVR